MRSIPRSIVHVVLWITGAILVLGLLLAGGAYLLTPRSESPQKAVREIEQRISAPGFPAELAYSREGVASAPELNGITGIVVCGNGDWAVYARYTTYGDNLEGTYHPIVARDNRGRWYRGHSAYSILDGLKNVHIPKSADHLWELGEGRLWPLETSE